MAANTSSLYSTAELPYLIYNVMYICCCCCCCCNCCPHGNAFFSKLIIIKLFIILDWNLRWVSDNHKHNKSNIDGHKYHNQMIQPIQSTKRKRKSLKKISTKQQVINSRKSALFSPTKVINWLKLEMKSDIKSIGNIHNKTFIKSLFQET